MPKPQYASEHQKARRRALALFVDGMPCPICRKPMRVWHSLDLNHVVPVARGGAGGPTELAHSYCNRRAGALIGNRSPKRRRSRIRRTRLGSGSRIGNDIPIKEGTPIKDGNHLKGNGRRLPSW